MVSIKLSPPLIRSLLGLVLMPLLIGGLVYVICRPSDARFLSWFGISRIDDPVINSYFISYVLPDFLWLFSFSNVLALIWRHERIPFLLWSLSTLVFTLCIEYGQLMAVVPGYFGYGDVVAFIMATLASIILYFSPNFTNSTS